MDEKKNWKRTALILAFRAFTCCILLLPLGIILAYVYIAAIKFDAGEHEALVDWLPPEASDICWYRSHMIAAFEFDMREDDFLNWAGNAEVRQKYGIGELERIGSAKQPYPPHARLFPSVTRYSYFLDDKKRKKAGLPIKQPPESRSNVSPERGWKFLDMSEIGCKLVYDADRQRVYYNWWGG